jgi:hypothetical protein
MVPAEMVAVMTSSNPTALETALIALGGALVGALIAAGTQVFIAWRQTKRDEAGRKKQVVIAARMMAVDLSRAESNLQYTIDYGHWWKTSGLSPRMSADDRRLVIGELTAKAFYEVDRAEAAIDYWRGIRDHEVAENHGYLSPTPGMNNEKLKGIIRWIDEARRALRDLTGDPESVEDAPGRGSG